MTGSLLDKYTGRTGNHSTEAMPPPESDGTEDLGTFGWIRGSRDRAIMLELRRKNGNILAISYSWLEKVEFDVSEGITLHCAGRQTLKIKGRNLNAEVRPFVRLFLGITRHRVPWIAEANEATVLQAEKTAVIVDALEWK
jgi:hypothetical protein